MYLKLIPIWWPFDGATEIDADFMAVLNPRAAVRRRQNASGGSSGVTVHGKQAPPSGLQ